VSSTTLAVHPALVDQMLELYCDWRTECGAVQSAYERFSVAAGSERTLAYAAYTAALDRECSAADAYAAQTRLITSIAETERKTQWAGLW
jgi:hypothetical protein